MELNGSNENNFWKNHSLDDFQIIVKRKSSYDSDITSICFLKDGRIACSTLDHHILIFNKYTFKIEISIEEKKLICYMNINKDGILIVCLAGTFLNLYEIKGKSYKIFQTIKPYSLLINFIGKFDNSFSIKKFVELKNGNLAILVWGYALSFYEKNKSNNKYSYLNKYSENVLDVCQLENNQYCMALEFRNLLQFLDMNLKKVTETIECNDFSFSESKNKLLLMNKKDLILVGKRKIVLVDIRNKTKIKDIKFNINFEINDYITSIYKLTDNILMAGLCNGYIKQLKYDDRKKEFKIISYKGDKQFDSSIIKRVNSISVFYNNIIAALKSDTFTDSSLVVYKLIKNKSK